MNASFKRWLAIAGAILLFGGFARSGHAQDLPTWGDKDDTDAGLLGDIEEELAQAKRDYNLLDLSYFSEVYRWDGIQPQKRNTESATREYGWHVARQEAVPPRVLVSRMSPAAATTVIAVPKTRNYRVWLGYVTKPSAAHPVTLTFSGATESSHTFGTHALPPDNGGDIEKRFPVRFEDDLHRISAFTGESAIWEFTDMDLNAGRTVIALTSADPKALVDAVFITASKSFVPSKSHIQGEGNIYRTYCRVRVAGTAQPAQDYAVGRAALGYHWRRIYRGETQPRWYGGLGTADDEGFRGEDGASRIPVGQWTRWVNVTEDVSNGPWARGGGPWATGRFSFSGVEEGSAEVQVAWFPHEGAVLRTIQPGIAKGAAVCMIPLETLSWGPVATSNDTGGVWGVRRQDVLDRFETAASVHERHFQWAHDAVAALRLPPDAPRPRQIRLDSGCNPAPAAREQAERMLDSLGLNDVGVKDPALLHELGHKPHYFIGANDSQYLCHTHDPLDPAAERNFEASLKARAARMPLKDFDPPPLVTLKMGDEIGTVAGEASINGLETCRAALHKYLRSELEAIGEDASFFGVETIDELPYLGALPPNPGLYERRLYYYCARFKFVLTAMYYAQITRAAERVFPNVQTYCNFSPHPPMFGQQMNGSDWFALTRNGGANMAWGEGWASGGGWGFVGYEVVSYYGAWVECAARPRNLPAGFYIVGTMGGSDKKLFSLLPHRIFNIQLYTWGPLYAGAEGSNFWSERRTTYEEVARGAYALGPADRIVREGRPWPAQVALLYNRTHEIWNGATGGFQSDRLLTFMALTHAHLPVDIILEEDLTDDALGQYRVLYVQGYNLDTADLATLTRWVEQGGTLVAVAGTAIHDRYDSPTTAAEALFGARQHIEGYSSGSWHPQSLPKHEPIDTLTLQDSALTEAMTVDVIGVKASLTPTTGKIVGTFGDGTPGAVLNTHSRGQTLLLGVTPGHIYKGKAQGSSRYSLDLRPLVTAPAEKTLSDPALTYSEPQTEVCLFEHEDGLAITLNNFAYFLEDTNRTATLTLRTDRHISEVSSSLRRPLNWSSDGNVVTVDLKPPEPVDVILFATQ